MIRLNHIGKRYGETWALHPFDGEISSGQVVALCGSNGAGKSTLLNLINGTDAPSTGEVKIDDISMKQRDAYNASFGYMPDDFSFDPAWTVEETFVYYALLQGVLPDRSLLGRVGLMDRSKQLVSALSKGMRQRLLLAQALVTQPSVLLLDEPTNGLDPVWIATLARLLREESERGVTIIFSTHQLDVASMLANEIWMMRSGIVSEKIVVEDERTAHERLKQFFFESRDDTCQNEIARTK